MSKCDVLLALGSSLIVHPAAAFVGRAIATGAKVALINRGQTPYDDVVALRVSAGIGDILPPAVERVKPLARDVASPMGVDRALGDDGVLRPPSRRVPSRPD